MASILTQQEIDDLLNQLSGGGGAEPAPAPVSSDSDGVQYKVHDFKTANKFSKEQMRTLNVIFENFGYMLSTRLTGMLRTVCDVRITTIEELIFSEFNNSIATPVVLAIIDAHPLKGSLLMEIPTAIAYALVCRTLGGVAEYSDSTKKFTEIELSVIENIINQMLLIFMDSWKKVVEIKPVLQRIETSPQFAQIAALNEPTAIVTLNVQIDNVEEIMSFCIPHYIIQPIAKRLNTMLWSLGDTHANEGEKQTDVLTQHLEETNVTLSAVLNDVEVALQDMLWLRPGDVLRLNHSVNEYITVKVEHIPKFKGIIGVSGQKQVVQIADVVKEKDSFE